jgi:hypothetical protein
MPIQVCKLGIIEMLQTVLQDTPSVLKPVRLMDLEKDKKQNKCSAGSTFHSSGLATSNTINNLKLLSSVWLCMST